MMDGFTKWAKKWAEDHGLDAKYTKEALTKINNLINNYGWYTDEAEAYILSSYSLNPPEKGGNVCTINY